jgi:hypothetical protein
MTPGRQAGFREALERRAFAPVDGASLAIFHIGFGALLLWDVWKLFAHD